MLAQASNPNTQEVESEGAQGHPPISAVNLKPTKAMRLSLKLETDEKGRCLAGVERLGLKTG